MTRQHRRFLPFIGIAALIVAVEAAIWIVGLATGSPGRLRMWLIQYAGFWPGLMGDWQSNFRLQPVSMFATYWIVHGGLVHLLGNLGGLAWLAPRLSSDLTLLETCEVWVASVMGGAIAFALLHHGPTPMIGASGGVFGFLGAFAVIDHRAARRRTTARQASLRTAMICLAILVLSLLDLALRQAALAWQAHLGGFLAGVVLTATIDTAGAPESRT